MLYTFFRWGHFMRWIIQNKKWTAGWLILSLLFSISASASLCETLFSINWLRMFQTSKPMHRIADLDQLALRVDQLVPSNGVPVPQALLVFKHPVLFNRYVGEKGLFLYAQVYFEGNIQKAMQVVEDYLSLEQYLKLGWHTYNWSVKQIEKEYSWEVFMAGGRIFRDMEGYALIANLYFDGDMIKAFDTTLAMSRIDLTMFLTRFGWKRFEGHTHHFIPLRRKVTNAYGRIIKQYRWEYGLNLFAKEFYNGDMYKSFIDMKLVLNAAEFKYLGWPEDFAITHRKKYHQRKEELVKRPTNSIKPTGSAATGLNGKPYRTTTQRQKIMTNTGKDMPIK